MEIDARSSDGNAFAIMVYVKKILTGANRLEEWPTIKERMMSGDYQNLCDVAEEVTHGSIVVVNRGGEASP